jgi:hypothetical protein
MTRIISLTAALSLALSVSAQTPAASDPTAFALALHRRLAAGENIMTSPYSLRQALGMVYASPAPPSYPRRRSFAAPSPPRTAR